MQGINHYCQTIQALNMSTQYKIILNRRGGRTWPALEAAMRQSPGSSGVMAEGTVRFHKPALVRRGCCDGRAEVSQNKQNELKEIQKGVASSCVYQHRFLGSRLLVYVVETHPPW